MKGHAGAEDLRIATLDVAGHAPLWDEVDGAAPVSLTGARGLDDRLRTVDAVDIGRADAYGVRVLRRALALGRDVLCSLPPGATYANAGEVVGAHALMSHGGLMVALPHVEQPLVATWMHDVRDKLGTFCHGEIDVVGHTRRASRRGGAGLALLPPALAVVASLLDVRSSFVVGGSSPVMSTYRSTRESRIWGTLVLGHRAYDESRGHVRMTASWGDVPRCAISLTGTGGTHAIELPVGPEAAQAAALAARRRFVARMRGEEPWDAESELALAARVQEIVATLVRSTLAGGDPVELQG